MKKNLKSGWFVILLIGLFLVNGNGFYSYAENKLSVIKIGSTAPGHLKFILNQQKGWWDEEFKKDGVKIEYYPFTGGGQEAMTALATGGLDVAYTGTDPALRTAASGADVYLIGLSSFGKNGGSDIVVRKDSPIKSVKDLNGKKVAFLTGTMRHATLAKALKLAKLSLKDVQGFNLPFEASGPALLRGDIDAIVESTSTIASLVETGKVKVILDGKDYPQWSNPSTISANGNFVRTYPQVIQRLLNVDLATSQWADANFEEALKVFAEGIKKKVEILRKDYPDGKLYQDPMITKEAIKAFKAEEQFLIEAKLANGNVNYKKWINRKFGDEAYAEQRRKIKKGK